MILVLVPLLAVAAALVQIGAVPAAFAQPLAGPVLPVALIAAWTAVRDPREAWATPVAAAIILGSVSEARVGWFLLALLPPAALVALARGWEQRGEATAGRRIALAALAGAVGVVTYVVILAAGGGALDALRPEAGAIVRSVSWTALLAAAGAAALWPLRPRGAGLFA